MTQGNIQLRNEPTTPKDVERPLPSASDGTWISDVIADCLRSLEIPYVALNPGASFRGLHDSIVNHLGNETPQMLLCLHEEHAVAIAHGWAKVKERPMAAILHSNVGLMHGTMAIFNAWCDRVPMIVVGATGPMDAAKRRPWIEWLHTAKDQGALIRGYTKWDDQPSSAEALVESFRRANLLSQTYPKAPTYVCLDVGLQETKLDHATAIPDQKRFLPPPPTEPSAEFLRRATELLTGAKRPLILAGRVSRDRESWNRRILLAEHLNAIVLTDLKTPAAFPTAHRLHPSSAGTLLTSDSTALLRQADVILSLDWVDLAGTLKSAFGDEEIAASIIHVSGDQLIHNGWSMDHQGLPPTDILLLNEPDSVTARLLTAIEESGERLSSSWSEVHLERKPSVEQSRLLVDTNDELTVPTLARVVSDVIAETDVCLIRGPLSWAGHLWSIDDPFDYLGIDGGAGLGSGPGIAVGAALALQGSGRVPLSIVGDGDFFMGATALWTAVHYRIPLLIIVANNSSFYNDELHQERMARRRGRVVENKWIGQRISDPDIDVAMLARAQGAVGVGPVFNTEALRDAVKSALAATLEGKVAVVDARVKTGYDANTTKAITNEGAS